MQYLPEIISDATRGQPMAEQDFKAMMQVGGGMASRLAAKANGPAQHQHLSGHVANGSPAGTVSCRPSVHMQSSTIQANQPE